MGLETSLAGKKRTIVREWLEMVAKTYAPDTASFLLANSDPFTNPVGETLSKGLDGLFDQLLKGPQTESVKSLLDPIIRIRAVQNFTPSQATAFILILKKIVRKHLTKELETPDRFRELLDFEARIDSLSLYAFDLYMQSREEIYELKANVERTKIYKAFERAGLIVENPDGEPGLSDHTKH